MYGMSGTGFQELCNVYSHNPHKNLVSWVYQYRHLTDEIGAQ